MFNAVCNRENQPDSVFGMYYLTPKKHHRDDKGWLELNSELLSSALNNGLNTRGPFTTTETSL